MSYTRTFHKTVTIPYSRNVTVDGKSVNISGEVSEVVEVNIHVETDPFDNQVHKCNQNVNLLTGAIAATEAVSYTHLTLPTNSLV